MARRTPRVKRNLPTWLNAISGACACNARKKLYDLENLEPRLLLSATGLEIPADVTERSAHSDWQSAFKFVN